MSESPRPRIVFCVSMNTAYVLGRAFRADGGALVFQLLHFDGSSAVDGEGQPLLVTRSDLRHRERFRRVVAKAA